MKWRLYKKDDPNTWPHIDCPMVVYGMHNNEWTIMKICVWNREFEHFRVEDEWFHYNFDECYYAYIGYIPSGYKTLYPIKCMCEYDDRCAYEDDGYCMFEDSCKFAKVVPEYEIEEKRIWKEFE